MISTLSRRGFLTTTGAAALSIVRDRPTFAQQFPARGILMIVPLRVEIIFVLLPYGRSELADHLVYDSQSRFADQAATATHEGGLEFSESRLCGARGAGEPRGNRTIRRFRRQP